MPSGCPSNHICVQGQAVDHREIGADRFADDAVGRGRPAVGMMLRWDDDTRGCYARRCEGPAGYPKTSKLYLMRDGIKV
jgi:hypothetical protein